MARTGLVSQRMEELSEQYGVPAAALLVFTIVGAIVAFIAAPLPTIYSLITDAVVAGYLGFAVNPVVMLALSRAGRPGTLPGGTFIAGAAFAAASLITYWSGWPSVPYGVVLLAIGAVAVTAIYRIRTGWTNALWYIVYILFLTLMTYIGDVGAQHLVNFDIGSLIVVIVSIVVFLPWGVASRLAEPVLTSQPGRVREARSASS